MRKTIILYALLGALAAIYIILGYFTDRADFNQLMVLFLAAFLLGGLLLRYFTNEYKLIAFVSIIFRATLLFCIPALSDDFYRFFWDGTLYSNGLNPYLYLPAEYISQDVLVPQISNSLFEKLNSPNYFTVYPPVCQYIFWVACTIGNNIFQSVLVMKIFILLTEIGSMLLILRLLKLYKIRENKVLIYALNPLVIMELSGNLHFEAVMIFFLLFAVFLLKTGRIAGSAATLALAVGAKLLPLIFLPFLLRRLNYQQMATYLGVIGVVLLLLFYPLSNLEMLNNIGLSINLYFQTFEFNASVYYLVRTIGYYVTGYNTIATIGPLLGGIAFVLILYLALRKKTAEVSQLFISMMLASTTYFLLSSTVHPWYLTTLVALAVFTNYKYAILWSFLVLLSYATYMSTPYQENSYLLWIEYLLVGGFMTYEIFGKRRKASVQQQPPPS